MKLLDLPTEILMNITELLPVCQIPQKSPLTAESRASRFLYIPYTLPQEPGRQINDLKNLRLVNRTFNAIASRVLFKRICVTVTNHQRPETIEKMKRISQMLDDEAFLKSDWVGYPRDLMFLVVGTENDSKELLEGTGALAMKLLGMLRNLVTFDIFIAARYDKVPPESLEFLLGGICSHSGKVKVSFDLQAVGLMEKNDDGILRHLHGLTDFGLGGKFRSVSEIADVIARSPKLECLSLSGRSTDVEAVLSSVTGDLPSSLRSLNIEGLSPPYTEASWSKLRSLKSLVLICNPWFDIKKRKRMWNSLRDAGIGLEKITFNSIEEQALDYLNSASSLRKLDMLLPHTAHDMKTTMAGAERIAARFWAEALPLLLPKLKKLEVTFMHIHTTIADAAGEDTTEDEDVAGTCDMWSLHNLGQCLKDIRMDNLYEVALMLPSTEPTEPSDDKPKASEILGTLINKSPRLHLIRLYFIYPSHPDKEDNEANAAKIMSWTSSTPFHDGVYMTAYCRASFLGERWVSGAAVRYLSYETLGDDKTSPEPALKRFISKGNRWVSTGAMPDSPLEDTVNSP